ncbi:unnamed protein product, partial [Pleuronectes platessa]
DKRRVITPEPARGPPSSSSEGPPCTARGPIISSRSSITSSKRPPSLFFHLRGPPSQLEVLHQLSLSWCLHHTALLVLHPNTEASSGQPSRVTPRRSSITQSSRSLRAITQVVESASSSTDVEIHSGHPRSRSLITAVQSCMQQRCEASPRSPASLEKLSTSFIQL